MPKARRHPAMPKASRNRDAEGEATGRHDTILVEFLVREHGFLHNHCGVVLCLHEAGGEGQCGADQ
jgi:hypothetical protein